MNTLIEAPKADFLLMEGLEAMHGESLEWISELEFWKTELSFFGILLNRHVLRLRSKKSQERLGVLEDSLRLFHKRKLIRIHKAATEHEFRLSEWDKAQNLSAEYNARDGHERLKGALSVFRTSMKNFRKEVFDFVEGSLRSVVSPK